MNLLFNFLYASLSTLFLPTIGILFYFFVFRPFLQVRFYKRQGAIGGYYPSICFHLAGQKNTYRHGDYMYEFHKIIKKQPSTRMFATNFGSKPVLYLLEPKLVKEYLNVQLQNYVKDDLFLDLGRIVQGGTLLFVEGKTWETQRKLISEAFQMDRVRRLMSSLSSDTLKAYENLGKKDLRNVDILAENEKVAQEALGYAFFGRRYSEKTIAGKTIAAKLNGLLKDGFAEATSIWTLLFGPNIINAKLLPRHKKLINELEKVRGICRELVKQQRERSETLPKENTFLQIFVDQQLSSPSISLTDDQIVDVFFVLILNGVDQNARTVSTTLYCLARNPKALEQIMKELNEVIRTDDDLIFENIQKLDYTFAAIKETLRIASPIPAMFFRRALVEHKLSNVTIHKGTLVTYSPIAAGFNEKYFSNPEVYSPERWLSVNKNTWEDISMTNPLSAGAKQCVAINLVDVHTRLMLASFLRKFTPKLKDVEPQKMGFNLITYKTTKPIYMNLST